MYMHLQPLQSGLARVAAADGVPPSFTRGLRSTTGGGGRRLRWALQSSLQPRRPFSCSRQHTRENVGKRPSWAGKLAAKRD
eukprot:COSAG02_NODE_34723_length_479_cov_1.213158_1_plen_80_part_10